MPSVETSIRQALYARVRTLPLSYMVAWPREPFTPPSAGVKPSPYIECRVNPKRNRRPYIGSNEEMDRSGDLQLSLCWPVSEVGTGQGKTHPDVLMEQAGQIAAHFPTDHQMSHGDVLIRVEQAPDILNDGYLDGPYIKIPVTIPWRNFA